MMAHASYVFISHPKNSDNNRIQNLTQSTHKKCSKLSMIQETKERYIYMPSSQYNLLDGIPARKFLFDCSLCILLVCQPSLSLFLVLIGSRIHFTPIFCHRLTYMIQKPTAFHFRIYDPLGTEVAVLLLGALLTVIHFFVYFIRFPFVFVDQTRISPARKQPQCSGGV